MTRENSKQEKSFLYWVTLATIFAAFIVVILS